MSLPPYPARPTAPGAHTAHRGMFSAERNAGGLAGTRHAPVLVLIRPREHHGPGVREKRMSQITTGETVDQLELPVLSALDRCDLCGAQAYIRVTLESGELLFCAHHGAK